MIKKNSWGHCGDLETTHVMYYMKYNLQMPSHQQKVLNKHQIVIAATTTLILMIMILSLSSLLPSLLYACSGHLQYLS